MEQVRIVRYDRALHYQEVLALLRHTPAKDLFWEWQYGGLVRTGEPFIEPLVALLGDTVVGFNGVMPVRLWVDGHYLEGAWSCDFVVAGSARRAGIGRRIKQRLLESGRLLLVSGASDDAARVHSSMGSDLSLDVQSFRRVIRPGRKRDRLLMIFQAIQGLLHQQAQDARCRYSLEDAIPGPEELDGLWARCQTGYRRAVVRDATYLRWRYAEHPFAHYRYLTARSDTGTLEAMLVLREHDGSAHIVDYLGPAAAPSLKAGLVAAAVALLRNVESWVTYTSDLELGVALRANRFYQTRTVHRFYVMASPEVPVTSAGWFIMPGDSDGDMLRAARDHKCPYCALSVGA